MKKFLLTLFLVFIFSVPALADGVTLPILLYHNITHTEVTYDFDVHISKRNFEEQMNYLIENKYNTITFKDYYNYRVNNTPLPENPILITFDDGYLSNYDIAYPFFKANGMHATIFMVTDSSYIPKTFAFPHFNWKEAKIMQDSGIIDIESHSAKHSVHTRLSFSECFYQARKSFFDIYKNLGKKPFVYAYPTGAFTGESQKIIEEAGYFIQCSVQGKLNCDSTPLNELKRLNIRGDITLEEFENLIKNSAF